MKALVSKALAPVGSSILVCGTGALLCAYWGELGVALALLVVTQGFSVIWN